MNSFGGYLKKILQTDYTKLLIFSFVIFRNATLADVLKLKNINILDTGPCESVAVSNSQIQGNQMNQVLIFEFIGFDNIEIDYLFYSPI